jgi:outer membrane lipoprotein SlyB
MQGIDLASFPALADWLARVAARPAVQRGMNIPPLGSVGQINRAVQGVIISARAAQISGRTALGGTVGAAGGAVAGSSIGGNTRSNILGALGGAVVGGLAGAAVEEGATHQGGVEYVVKSDNGALLTIAQGDDHVIQVGDKVIVLYGPRSRIIEDTCRRQLVRSSGSRVQS